MSVALTWLGLHSIDQSSSARQGAIGQSITTRSCRQAMTAGDSAVIPVFFVEVTSVLVRMMSCEMVVFMLIPLSYVSVTCKRSRMCKQSFSHVLRDY